MFKIVADSSCDLIFPKGSREDSLFRKVPLTIISQTKNYIDDGTLDGAAMMAELSAEGGRTSTACPAPGAWEQAFEGADEIFALTITSKLSGSYNSARVARENWLETHPSAQIHLIDTFSCGSEISLLVIRLIELIGQGLSFDEICAEIEKYRQGTGLLFMLNSLENLIRNGRVSRMAGAAARLLNINIIGRASEEGEFQIVHKVRRSARVYSQVFDEMIRRGYDGGKVILSHCVNPEGAACLRALIREAFKNADVTIMPAGGLCSFYAEIGGLLIGFEHASPA